MRAPRGKWATMRIRDATAGEGVPAGAADERGTGVHHTNGQGIAIRPRDEPRLATAACIGPPDVPPPAPEAAVDGAG